jgi:hypothetical protein
VPDQPPPESGPDSRFLFQGNPRDVYIVAVNEDPDIPDGQGRPCPQCGRTAWLNSRWCWHCKFDFDRASVARWHPTKVLMLSIALNIVLTVMLAAAIFVTHRH